ncbi:MAG: tRNA uridine-5-carboxymethylaminomethyl(34) synthesis GTPase MnmE [Candidatus Omnitrophota bacterium]|nr:tRNA uridine-5-carboxymethylaminomethyl(34) synthesis GTPase MnmE [Candidatus Omnitrophota bacterium]
MKRNSNNDTIAAVSTPVGEGGIGIVRLSGRDSMKIADRIFLSSDKIKPSRFKTHTIHYGYIIDKDVIDEVLLTVMRAPGTYTREDVVEINCHGGITALRKVLALIVKNGARLAEPGEFTKRAFLNGRLDLTQAEAVLDIIKAKTDTAMRASLNQLEGELSKEIKSAREEIIDILADVEAVIDFSEEDIETNAGTGWLRKAKGAKKRLQKLRDTYHDGAILREGITAVICGRPNVGKSSLMNILLRKNRVIVTHMPGTTRDAIEETVNIRGVPIKLVDTAGIREDKGLVEKEGIEKSRQYLSRADLVLCMLDGSEGLKKEDKSLLKKVNGRSAIIIINKCDLRPKLDIREVKKISGNKNILKISCLKKIKIDKLRIRVYNRIWSGKVYSSHQVMLNNIRHKNVMDRSLTALSKTENAIRHAFPPEFIALDLKESINSLGEILGEVYTDDILDVIFSKFCIGK